MTQMLLFDAPVGIADSAVLPVADCGDVVESTTLPRSSDSERGLDPGRGETEGGLHHMGDLARLVLLRDDLMAKRRAQYAARRRAR